MATVGASTTSASASTAEGNGAGSPPHSLTILTAAYNEERNLPGFLEAVLAAQPREFMVKEVVVVASGCTDGTLPLLKECQARDGRIRTIVQSRREGKVSALRLGLSVATGDIVVVVNSDTLPGDQSLSALALPLAEGVADLTCGRPIPTESTHGLAESFSAVEWELHDYVSRTSPKTGEAYAFLRKNPPYAPGEFDDDDSMISVAVASGFLRARYCREATIYNNPPRTMRDYCRRRIRVNRHLARAARQGGARASTWNPLVLSIAGFQFARERPSRIAVLGFFFVLETALRLVSLTGDLGGSKSLATWEPTLSSKERVSPLSNDDGTESELAVH